MPRIRPAIVGGTLASQGQLPYMAFVVAQLSTTTVGFCSGTVVAPNVVLTAGHCVIDESTDTVLSPSEFAVVTGSVDWTNSAVRQVSDVSQVIVDPLYDPATDYYDAALLILSTPTTAPAIPLAGASDVDLDQAGTEAIIAGWGETSQGSGISDNLEWGSTVVQSPAYCSQFNSTFTYDSLVQLCSVDYPYNDTGTCNGDSGGPLIASDADNQPVEIGVTDYGPVDCDTVTADVFARVDQISSWAEQEIQEVAPAPPPPAAPSPPSSPTPAPQLPRMSRSSAASFTHRTLAGIFGRRFRRARQYRAQCSRTSDTRFNCAVSWWNGPTDYWGTVTVYYVSSEGQVDWSDTYRMNTVKDACYEAHRNDWKRACTIRHFQGSW